MNKLRLPAATLLIAAAAALAACGGGSTTDAPVIAPPVVVPPLTAVPDSSGLTIASFISFLTSLSATDETSEPLTIGSTFAAASDDTVESTPL